MNTQMSLILAMAIDNLSQRGAWGGEGTVHLVHRLYTELIRKVYHIKHMNKPYLNISCLD